MQKAEALIRDQFPPSQWPVIPRVLRTAYQAADDLMRDSPILQVESAKDNRGRLISFAVDTGIQRAIENGSIPCDYRWVYFDKPTGRYLELRFSHSTASISQVRCAARQPRSVVYRENARLRNQGVLSFPGFDEDPSVIGLQHFYIVHGYQSLCFAHLALPSADREVGYEWRSLNLISLPHVLEPEGPAPEDTDYDPDELASLKDEIDRWRRDSDGD